MENFKHLEHIFESAPIGIFESSLEGQFLDLNNELVKILGYNSKQDVFDHIQSIEKDLYENPDMRHEMLRAIEGKKEISIFEYRVKKKDQSIIDVRLSIRPFWNEDQQRLNNVGIVEDITELKKVQKKQEEQESRYRLLFENSNDAILIYKYDELLEYNEKALDIFGAKNNPEFIKIFNNLNPKKQPDGRISSIAADELVDKCLNNEPQFFEWVHLKADGTPFYAEISLSKISGMNDGVHQAIIRDITDKIHLKNNLVKRESILSSIIDSTPTEMWVINFDGYIIAQSGYSKKNWGDLTSQNIDNIKEKTLQNQFDNAPIDKIKKGKIVEKNLQLVYEEKPIYYKVIWSPYREAEKINGYVLYSYDLTAEKELQEKLKAHKKDLEIEVKKRTAEISALNNELLVSNDFLNEINQELIEQKEELQNTINKLNKAQAQLIQSEKMASIGVLTSGIAHEINNPINFISSGIYGLRIAIDDILKYVEERDKNCTGSDQNRCKSLINSLRQTYHIETAIDNIPKLMHPIQNGIDRTTEIIKGLRTFSRLDNEEKTIGNVSDIIDSTLVILKNKYKNRIDIELDLDPVVEILCYPGKLGQIILNITMNAIQAIDGKGKIIIKTHFNKEKDEFTIQISDTGNGLDKETQAKVFDPFFTTKPLGIGTGIGLSIVHGIVEDHGGSIDVESKVGIGTTFNITLPTK